MRTFNTSHFQDAKFMTAKEKQRVLRAWERFLKNGLQFQHFTKALYNHLIQHCSFIAHYDRHGFFRTYFVNPEDTKGFLDQFDRSKGCVSVEYGDNYWIRDSNSVCKEYYDINNAMVDVLEPLLPEILRKLNEQGLEIAEKEIKVSQEKVKGLRKDLACKDSGKTIKDSSRIPKVMKTLLAISLLLTLMLVSGCAAPKEAGKITGVGTPKDIAKGMNWVRIKLIEAKVETETFSKKGLKQIKVSRNLYFEDGWIEAQHFSSFTIYVDRINIGTFKTHWFNFGITAFQKEESELFTKGFFISTGFHLIELKARSFRKSLWLCYEGYFSKDKEIVLRTTEFIKVRPEIMERVRNENRKNTRKRKRTFYEGEAGENAGDG